MSNVISNAFALLALAALVSSRALQLRNDLDCGNGLPCFREECDAAKNPTWEDCKSLHPRFHTFVEVVIGSTGEVVWQTIHDSAGGDSAYMFSPRKCFGQINLREALAY